MLVRILFSVIIFLHIPVIPAILEDSRRILESYSTSGTFDPFEKVYEVSLLRFVCSFAIEQLLLLSAPLPDNRTEPFVLRNRGRRSPCLTSEKAVRPSRCG